MATPSTTLVIVYGRYRKSGCWVLWEEIKTVGNSDWHGMAVVEKVETVGGDLKASRDLRSSQFTILFHLKDVSWDLPLSSWTPSWWKQNTWRPRLPGAQMVAVLILLLQVMWVQTCREGLCCGEEQGQDTQLILPSGPPSSDTPPLRPFSCSKRRSRQRYFLSFLASP